MLRINELKKELLLLRMFCSASKKFNFLGALHSRLTDFVFSYDGDPVGTYGHLYPDSENNVLEKIEQLR